MSNPTRVAWLIPFVVTATAFAGPPPGRAAATAVRTEALHPVERQVREQFPSVALDSQATLDPAQEIVAGQMVSGLRARPLQRAVTLPLPGEGDASSGNLRILYPASYNDAFVVEVGEQRVALRAVGAHFAQAASAAGKLFYTSPHDSVDVIEVPSTGRSEELLLLHDSRAPRIFEYEIVEMRGVAGLSVSDGAIRFAPDHVVVPTATQMVNGRFTAPQPSIQIDRPWVIDANGTRSESATQWTILEQKDQPRRIRLTINSEALAYPIVVDPSFSATGSLGAARYNHTSTLLPNGKVLLAGGTNGSVLSTAELYDPARGTFAATSGPMTSARYNHTATLLPNGKVLLAGGNNGSTVVNTAELYDPASGTFTATVASMTSARVQHTATLLPNGKVLLAGGEDTSTYTGSAELYDPAAGINGTFTATSAPMTAARALHTATLLLSGRVLIAGGINGVSLHSAELYDPASVTPFTATSANMTAFRYAHTATLLANGTVLIAGGHNTASDHAEVYDPAAGTNGTFTQTGTNMQNSREGHSATLLPNGKVLIAGGLNAAFIVNTSADLYDPVGGFTATSGMPSARYQQTATLLPSGTVLLAGGSSSSGGTAINGALLYDPTSAANGTFTATTIMTSTRNSHTATLLTNGKVLIAGGDSGTTAELFDPASGTFTATSAAMTSSRMFHTATLLPNGKVLITGGYNGSAGLNTAELYDPTAGTNGTFTATNTQMTSARYDHTATLLPNGKVLITGGYTGSAYLNIAELYDPASGTFTATSATMTSARRGHTATLLANGKVLLAAGSSFSADLNSAELYDPASGTFTATSTMTSQRSSPTAMLLPNGKVLISGGGNVFGTLNTAELYDPAAGTNGTFTATNTMTSAREYHTATLLPSGRVLIAGGFNSGTGALNTAELYDPAAGTNGTFTATVAMTATRQHHTAMLLPNGKVLIAGGFSNKAELYDASLGFLDTRRPVVSSLTNPLCQPANLALSGSLFTGDSEGSSGSTNSSATNAPLLRLKRVDNEQSQFALSQNFSASNFFSATLSNLASGRYRTAIVSNAIPSIEQIIDVETTPLLGTYSTASVNLFGSTTVTPTSLPPGYNGAFYPLTPSASGGFTGTLETNGTTGAVTATNAGPTGDYTVTVLASNSCGSPSTTFTLKVIGSAAAVVATGGTPQSAQTSTAFATQLQATVTDSAGHLLNNITVNFTAPPQTGASATFSNAFPTTNTSGVASTTATANGNLGSYSVTATVGGFHATFALTNNPATPTNVVATATTTTSVSITWNGSSGATYEVHRISVGNVDTTAGTSASGSLTDTNVSAGTAYLYKVRAILPSTTPFGAPDLATTVIFTDPSLVAGISIKAAHITQLRTAVDAVRALAGMGGGSYTTDPTINAGVTIIKRAHLIELRTALDQARASTTAPMPLPAIVYTTPNIVAGTTTIAAADINDLRGGVR